MKRWLLALGALVLLVAIVISIDVSQFLNKPLALEQETFDYTVKPGSSVSRITADFHERQSLSRPLYFKIYASLSGQATRIHAGEYRIDPQQTPLELLALLTAGRVKQYSFTIIEGWTFKQLLQALKQDLNMDQQLTALSNQEIMTRLGFEGEHPEGRFLPDTYHFPKGTSDLDFLKRAHKKMRAVLELEWQQRAAELPLKDAYEALTLASIVERETAVPAERPQIAGVFVERLKRRMRLQTDPTVIYGMGEDFKGNIRFKDLRKDTPYNTYTRFGLPPTPIAMPSAAAINAVLHPQITGALYFVARGDGSHQFSKTLDEHNAAVVKYQLGGNAKKLRRRN